MGSFEDLGGIQAVRAFVKESNKIEGILEVREIEIQALSEFLNMEDITVADMCNLVTAFTSHARLRNAFGMNVKVGNHTPPPGGPLIIQRLQNLLYLSEEVSPWETHCEYETLHPFEDGNGRSGRALWLWQMQLTHRGSVWAHNLGFLHSFYYQTLQEGR